VGPKAGLDDVEKRKFLIVPGFELRPLGRPARSQSLYRLRYPGSLLEDSSKKNRTIGNLNKMCGTVYEYIKKPVGLKLSLYSMKMYGRWKYSSTILDLGTNWRRVVSFTPRPLCPRYSLQRVWVGPNFGLHAVEQRKVSFPSRRIEPWPSSSQPVALPTELTRLSI
jgi:hypothetical protein